jgi:curli biogenesis system outer membrane secretion channel CsgG
MLQTVSARGLSRFRLRHLAVLINVALLSGCVATAPRLGSDSAKTAATGAAGGAVAEDAGANLERCTMPFGTVAIVEDSTAPWYRQFTDTYNLGSTVPALRLLVQQSNCFVIVERGKAFQAIERERALQRSGDLRQNSNVGPGQLVAADYSISPEVLISARGTSGAGGALRGLAGRGTAGLIAGAVAGGIRTNEASTMLTLIDNRSGIQIAAAEGSASNTDFNLAAALGGSAGSGGAGAYTNTPQGKVVIAAFTDSYNGMVRALRHYAPQAVPGKALGSGGRLAVEAPPAAPMPNANATTPPSAAQLNVKEAQDRLIRLGYKLGTPDGVMGRATVAALREFQKSLKLAVTGILDEATVRALAM